MREIFDRYEQWYKTTYLPFLEEWFGEPDDLEDDWTAAFELTPAGDDELELLTTECGSLPEAYEQMLRTAGYGDVNAPGPDTHIGDSGQIIHEGDDPEPDGGFVILSPKQVVECRAYLVEHFAQPDEASAAADARARGLGPDALLPVAGGGGHDFMIVVLSGPEQGKLFRWYHDCSVAENLKVQFATDFTEWLKGVFSSASRCEPTMVPG